MMVASKKYGAWLQSRVGGILCIAVVDGGKLYSIDVGRMCIIRRRWVGGASLAALLRLNFQSCSVIGRVSGSSRDCGLAWSILPAVEDCAPPKIIAYINEERLTSYLPAIFMTIASPCPPLYSLSSWTLTSHPYKFGEHPVWTSRLLMSNDSQHFDLFRWTTNGQLCCLGSYMPVAS
jgi:hypothetical protein